MQLPRRDYGRIKPCAIWWILDAIHRASIRVRINVRVRIRIRVSDPRWIASSAHRAILERSAVPAI